MFNHQYQDLDINDHNDDDDDAEMGKLVDTTSHSGNDNNRKVLLSWSELDQDTLGEIMCKLPLLEKARFRAVCKTWHATHPAIGTTTMSLPWYVIVESRSVPMYDNLHRLLCKPYNDQKPSKKNINVLLEFKTYDPTCDIHPRPLSVFTITLTQLFGLSPSLHPYINDINPVKNGWFFIYTSEEKRKRSRYTRCHLVFFSPLTKKVIKLPTLDYPYDCNFVCTFSTDPESPDCVFITLGDKGMVTTFHKGEKEWEFRQIDLLTIYMRYVSIPVCVDGIFYIVSSYGQLISYNTIDGKLEYERPSKDSSLRRHWLSHQLSYWSSHTQRVFMLDGELMVLFLSHKTMDHTLFPSFIRKFDWTNKVWMPVNDLGDNALFVRHKAHCIVKVGKEATRNYTEASSNKLYYFHESGCLVYSLENGNFIQLESTSVYLRDFDVLSAHMYNWMIRGNDDAYRKLFFWLEPPVIA